MREIRKKWILANVINEVLKAVVVLGGLLILGIASGIAEGTVPVFISLLAIVGLGYICRDCMDAVVELEDIIDRQEWHMKQRKRKAAELSRRIKEISHKEIDFEMIQESRQIRKQV